MSPDARPSVGGGAVSRPPPGPQDPCPTGATAGAPRRGDHGSVTAELAVVLPAVVMLLAVLLTAAAAAGTQVRVSDAARAAARAAALGESEAAVVAVARDLAGEGAAVVVSHEAEYVLVEVSHEIPGLLGMADLEAGASARAMPEPGVGR
ncbi:hypothetical protein GCM10023169_10680 [Georgenia halophila]|uniref:TadE-like domain-containing protein n=1 Tax=Georgenia halophila TaxID=620889 RepID=A0ABP8L0I9_9MICO